MFDRLEKHHFGFIVSIEEKAVLENQRKEKFILDPIQQTHVLFVYDESLKIYIEYICREGRVKNHKPGFAHICYNVKNRSDLEQVEVFIRDRKLGFKLTNLEKSASKECGWVTFYFLKDIGVIELNLMENK